MKCRVLGRTGLKVSEIGFGAHEYRRPLPTTLGRWGEIDTEQFMKTQPPRAELMRRHDCFDTVMVRYNYHLQEAREALFPLCKALDVGVVVMKPLTWPYYGIF
jgi:aryl-alcohol dehydrogenase-like predicted oxidoreductase